LRGQVPPFDAAQLRAEFVAQARSKDATRQHAGVLGLAALMASEPYNVPTWLLDVAQALAQHSSVSSHVCRDRASVFPHARPCHRRARRHRQRRRERGRARCCQ
jgi:hypothetical protein